MRRLFIAPIILTLLYAGSLSAQSQPAPTTPSSKDKPASPPSSSAPTASQTPAQDTVAARIDGETIMRSEVVALYETLPPEYRQLPLEAFYPQLLDRLIERKLAVRQARKDRLQETADVKKRLAGLEDRVLHQAYLEKAIKEKTTDTRMKVLYDKQIASAPAEDEVHARHILVKTEDEAKAIIAELAKGKDFSTLAQEKSIDPGAKGNGGDLGFFTKDKMVKPFADAAFAMAPGTVSKTPTQSQFGWHVIKVEEKRKAKPPTFEESIPALREALAEQIVEETMTELRTKAKIEVLGSDGKPMPTPNSKDAPGSGTSTTPTPAKPK
ncbi:MAG: peptidylprolyl isomerase [Alphaproteobacteria bacterium]